MHDPRRLREMYRLESEATLHWPAMPLSGRRQFISGVLAAAGLLMITAGVLRRWPILAAAGLLPIAGAGFTRWRGRERAHRARAMRRRVAAETGCRTLGLARHAGGIPYMKTYLRRSAPIVLGLSPTHLTVFLPDPLQPYVTIPLADVTHIFAGANPPRDASWDEDSLDRTPERGDDLLNVVARLGSKKTYRLVFQDFEPGMSAGLWQERIARACKQVTDRQASS